MRKKRSFKNKKINKKREEERKTQGEILLLKEKTIL